MLSVPSFNPVPTVTVYVAPLPEMPVIAAPVTPLWSTTKSPVPAPVTDSLNVTVKLTLAAFVGFASARTIDATVGGVLSIVYASPAVKSAVETLPTASVAPPSASASKSIDSVPSFEPVPTVNVYVVPLPEMPVTLAPVTPL